MYFFVAKLLSIAEMTYSYVSTYITSEAYIPMIRLIYYAHTE